MGITDIKCMSVIPAVNRFIHSLCLLQRKHRPVVGRCSQSSVVFSASERDLALVPAAPRTLPVS